MRCFLVRISTSPPLADARSSTAAPRRGGRAVPLRSRPPLRGFPLFLLPRGLLLLHGLPGLLAIPEPRDVSLLRPFDAQRSRRDVPRDRGPGPGHGPVPHTDRRDQHGVRADPHLVADHRGVLVPPIVVNGDGARSDVGVSADRRVAHVGQVRDLRAPTDPSPTSESAIRVEGPSTQSRPTRVLPSRTVSGWITVSGPIRTSAST